MAYGYRRLTAMLRREGWLVSTKRVFRLFWEEALQVRTKNLYHDEQETGLTEEPTELRDRYRFQILGVPFLIIKEK
jgi:hypothetical protein